MKFHDLYSEGDLLNYLIYIVTMYEIAEIPKHKRVIVILDIYSRNFFLQQRLDF